MASANRDGTAVFRKAGLARQSGNAELQFACKIRINGIIGQEVFIGDRVYGVGSTVLGARIVQVLPESVVFSYKGQRFTKKVQLK